MATTNRYVFCANNCKYEAYDKEQVDGLITDYFKYQKVTKEEYDLLYAMRDATQVLDVIADTSDTSRPNGIYLNYMDGNLYMKAGTTYLITRAAPVGYYTNGTTYWSFARAGRITYEADLPGTYKEDVLYIISDDTTIEDILNGTKDVPEAAHAAEADKADIASAAWNLDLWYTYGLSESYIMLGATTDTEIVTYSIGVRTTSTSSWKQFIVVYSSGDTTNQYILLDVTYSSTTNPTVSILRARVEPALGIVRIERDGTTITPYEWRYARIATRRNG